MKVFQGFEEIHEAFPAPIVTIGNFDGLHLGHRRIIESVIDRAREQHGTAIVYTFRPHPHLALTPDANLQLINTYDEKLDLLSKIGVDVVIEQSFSRQFSTITPERFFNDILVKRLAAHAIYVGYDFGFGKNRSGNLELLRKFCEAEGVELTVAKPLKVSGEICSSSRIRSHLLAGDVSAANRLLGREFFYRGVVVRGDGRGRKLGFATANVKTESKFQVRPGVYATQAAYKGRTFGSVTNVGQRPTFISGPEAPVTVETHIFDFNKDIYGETLEVRMVERLRDEKKFSGIEALVAQIKLDVEAAKTILGGGAHVG